MTKLAIIETDDSGDVTGIVRDLGRCTPDKWDAFEKQVTVNAERLQMQNQTDARLSLLLKAAESAGFFTGNQINLYRVIEPCVQNIIVQHEQKKGLIARFDHWKQEKRSSLIRWVVKTGMSIAQRISGDLIKSLKK